MLPDQPDNPTRTKILHPQHARPPPHPHHLSGEPSSLFKTCSRSKVQVIQNSVTMHTLLGYQSRVSTIRSQVGVLITRNRLFTWNNRFLQQHHPTILYLLVNSSGRAYICTMHINFQRCAVRWRSRSSFRTFKRREPRLRLACFYLSLSLFARWRSIFSRGTSPTVKLLLLIRVTRTGAFFSSIYAQRGQGWLLL